LRLNKTFILSSSAVNHSFEAEKNRKALLYTSCIVGAFLIIAIFYTWPLQIPPIPAVQDLIDVNLGNEQEGMGNVQPLVKGERAPDDQSVPSSHAKASKAAETPSRNVQADENNDDKEAAPVTKIEKPRENAKEINKTSTEKPSKKINPSPVVNPNPAPPKPKLPLYKGGNGNGGNGATEDNGYRNQGYKPGNGDAGSPDGKADAYGNSPGGRSGVSVVRGLSGRRPIRFPSMTDDFNENAKVYVDIKVDASGKVVEAGISRGTTTSNSSLRTIAIDKARQLRFPTSQNDIESGTILFVFVLKN
jgi:outer membrane biosynthesis protein TonB